MLDRHAVLASYTELGSMSKVASRFNCTVQAIKNILLAHDIVPQTASEILSGSGNPFFGKSHPKDTREFCALMGAIHGTKFWEDHPEYIEVVRAKATEHWSDLTRRAEDSKRISELRAAGKCGSRKGSVKSRFGEIAFDSSYECEFVEFCEQDHRIVFVERDFELVEYEYEGKRNFVPDFRLWLSNGDFLIVEIKSDWYSKKPKERQKIIAGFGKFFDKFMVLSHKRDFTEVSSRINSSLTPVDFSFNDLKLRSIESDLYTQFYGLFHYIGKSGRRGPTMGAFLDGRLIAAATIGSITRAEMAEKQGLTQSEMRELVRFCIHPDFHKPNFGSWLLSRVVAEYKANHKDVKMLISFADKSHGHAGTIYKAANWIYDGETGPSYHYVDQSGLVHHKKTIYNLAKGLGISERDYAVEFKFQRVAELPKSRFLLPLGAAAKCHL